MRASMRPYCGWYLPWVVRRADVYDPFGDGNEVDPDELRQDVQDWFEYAEQSYATAEQIRGWPDCEESEQTPEQEEQSAGEQDVDGHDPLEVRPANAEVLADRRERDVHDRDVEHDHELGD